MNKFKEGPIISSCLWLRVVFREMCYIFQFMLLKHFNHFIWSRLTIWISHFYDLQTQKVLNYSIQYLNFFMNGGCWAIWVNGSTVLQPLLCKILWYIKYNFHVAPFLPIMNKLFRWKHIEICTYKHTMLTEIIFELYFFFYFAWFL